MKRDFGKRLAELRKLCRPSITQEQLSEKLTVSSKSVSAWENGRRKISLDDRHLLLTLIQVLYENQGIGNLEEANAFLMSGGYSPLSADEAIKLFPVKPTIEKSELPPPEPAASYPLTFTHIWYDTKKYSSRTIIRNYDVGTLFIYPNKITYKGKRGKVTIECIQEVNHFRQTGSVSPNWVELIFGSEKPFKAAYLAEGRKLGIGELVGGSEKLFRELYKLFGR